MSDISARPDKAAREARASRMAVEADKARREYDAEIEARDKNTARLKALRLERERVEAETAEANAPAAKPRKRAKAGAKVS